MVTRKLIKFFPEEFQLINAKEMIKLENLQFTIPNRKAVSQSGRQSLRHGVKGRWGTLWWLGQQTSDRCLRGGQPYTVLRDMMQEKAHSSVREVVFPMPSRDELKSYETF